MLGLMLRVCFVLFPLFFRDLFAGQAPILFQMPEPIDEATPKEVHSRASFDGNEYELVFSDEFEVEDILTWCVLFHSFVFFISFFVFSSFSSFLAVMTIQRNQDLRTVSLVFSRSHVHDSIASSPNFCTPFFSFACERFEFFRLPGVAFLRSMRFYLIFVLSAVMMQRSFRLLSSWPPAYPLMTMTILWSYMSSTCTPFEFLNLPRVWVLIFVSSKAGGPDDMIRRPLCMCSDLDSSPPRWVVSYLSFCVLFYVFRILSFSSLRFVLFRFLFFTILAIRTLVSPASFSLDTGTFR